ncbi:MAG TPA: protein-disulfide reductase DsbD domain-containing protein, partial [Candidatus Polarisedimenticolia bacterium]|nr:protein-disulfide reductase DsbD domain-containing protein [Candidatus Polarisedimenticolia bacterium]
VEYRRVAEEIVAWATREMTLPEGGFCSALDADSEGGEGAYYLWSRDEIMKVLGEQDGELFARTYGIEENGNFVDPVTGEEPGNIPHLKQGFEDEALRTRMDAARAKLLEVRTRRSAPGRDDKVVTSWNGLMIGALARSGRLLERPEYVKAAARAAGFVLNELRRDGRLLRSWREGEARLPGYLEDHAFLAWGLLDLHEATGEKTWLDEARGLAGAMIERFWDDQEGGFFFVASDHESLIARTKEVFDQAVPSGNGMAARVLVRLWKLTEEKRYEERAAKMFQVFAGILEQAPRAAEHLLLAFLAWSEGKPKVVSSTPAPSTRRAEVATPPSARVQRGPVIASADLSKPRIAPGESTELRLTLEIEPGWHLQSAKPTKDELIATSVALGLGEGLKPGEMKFPDGSLAPIGGERLSVYMGKIAIRVAINADAGLSTGRIPGLARVRFQACDDKRCLNPEQVELTFAVEVST